MWHMKRQGANILSYFSNSKKVELECEKEPEEFDSDSDLETIRSDKTDSGLLTSLESQSSTTTDINQ